MTTPRSRMYDEVAVGEALSGLSLPLTRTLIVATAIAGRDFQDVHHDPALARQRGSKDIFMNILTSNGLVDRYVTAWAGPAAVVKAIRIRLGAPNHPGDTMVFSATVSGKGQDGRVDIEVTGTNSLGVHLAGTVTVCLPSAVNSR